MPMLPIRRARPESDRAASERPAWSTVVALVAPLALPIAAFAHAGHADVPMHGLSDGLLHPFTGLDHLAAMAALGAWTGADRLARWPVPVAFAIALCLGAAATMAGLALPAVEPLVALTVLLAGLLLASRRALPRGVAVAVAAAFGAVHGAAHGIELQGLSAMAGILAGSAALQAAGIAAGLWMSRRAAAWSRGSGAVVAVLGGVLLASAA